MSDGDIPVAGGGWGEGSWVKGNDGEPVMAGGGSATAGKIDNKGHMVGGDGAGVAWVRKRNDEQLSSMSIVPPPPAGLSRAGLGQLGRRRDEGKMSGGYGVDGHASGLSLEGKGADGGGGGANSNKPDVK